MTTARASDTHPDGASRASETPELVQRALRHGRTLLVAYAQVLFCTHPMAGALLAAATLVVWQHGVAGFLAMVATNVWAVVMGRPRAHIDDGYYGFNGLLVGLALGLYFEISTPFVILLAIVSLLTVVVAGALRNLADRYVGVPVLSLPFVLVTWTALLAARRFTGVAVTTEPVLVTQWGMGVLPEAVEVYLRSLGACYFQMSLVSGVLVFAGLLVGSRWATILSMLGFATGYAVYVGLGGHPSDLAGQLIGFNFVLTAIAVGGAFVLLSPSSILLAAGSGALSAVVSAALAAWLEPFLLPVLAIPFIVVTQLLLFTFIIRTYGVPQDGGAIARGPVLVRGAPDTPERNLARTAYRAKRYPDPAVPVVYLPIMGDWVITQGPNGDITHQGLWSHAWDFEVADLSGDRYRGTGDQPTDYFAWNAPVLAPADGKVVRVIAHLDDNPIGEVDIANNWGNLVVIWHAGGVYSMLCHLMKDSVTVTEGQSLVRGQVIGRVGNSGRSPVPHLHFQLQRSPAVGAPTCYAELLHYVRTGPDEVRRYQTHGVPQTGDHVAPLQPSEPVRRAMTLAPGRRWRWVIREGSDLRIETWLSTIDPLGERRLEVVDNTRESAAVTRGSGDRARQAGSSHAAFYADDRYLTLLDYHGSAKRLLALFYVAMARAPYSADTSFEWHDHPTASPFLSLFGRLGHELLLPFAVTGAIPTTSRFERDERSGAGLRVVTQLAPSRVRGTSRLPDTVAVDWAPDTGPTRIRAWRHDSLLLDAVVTPEDDA